MIKDKRIMSIFIIVGLIIMAFILNGNVEKNFEEKKIEMNESVNTDISMNKEHILDKDFKTNLPLIILDTKGEEIIKSKDWNKQERFFEQIDGEIYTEGEISVINNEERNTLDDKPQIKSKMKIRTRGNSSIEFEKKQFGIKLLDEKGKGKKQDLLGIGVEDEWILNISQLDKSLLRNYLGYKLSSEILEYTPETRYCEVVFKGEKGYEYQGIYMLMEKIERSETRVEISEYDKRYPETAFIIKRDRKNNKDIYLNNYGTEEVLTTGALSVEYPKKDEITDESIQYITEKVNELEKTLFAKDKDEFYKYREYIDEERFIDYFIINEFLGNYDAGKHSTFFYKEVGGKIKAGPVWDFDGSIDNGIVGAMKIDSTAFHDSSWYRQLLRDGEFVERIIKRYEELRKDVLSDENLEEMIDKTCKYIAGGQARDFYRWEKQYLAQDDRSYSEEIEKLKSTLFKHGAWLDENIDSLYQFSEFESHNEHIKLKYINGLGVFFVVIFLISIYVVKKK